MADYKAMYYKIFNKVSDVIGELQAIQVQTEAMYADSNEPEMRLLKQEAEKKPQDGE